MQRWPHNLPSDEVDAKEMRAVAWGFEGCRACRHRMLRLTPRYWQHLAAGMLSCPPLTSLGQRRPSECFRPQRLRVQEVLEIPVPLRPRSTPMRRVLQRLTAELRTGMCRTQCRMAQSLRRCIRCAERNSSQTQCGRPPWLTSRRRPSRPSAISLPITRMRRRRFPTGCPTSR